MTRQYSVKSLLVCISTIFVCACSTSPEANYNGYFFQDNADAGQKAFSYILYLGDIEDREVGKKGIGVVADTRRDRRELRSSSRAKPKEGEAESLSFRMEEEAYKRLEIKLKELNFCKNEVEYTASEYDWLKYTIKGHCK